MIRGKINYNNGHCQLSFSCNQKKKKKNPSNNSRKAGIQEWLQQNNIKYHRFETVTELLQKVKQYKSVGNVYKLDQLALERGHKIICLSPYHCQYNPIELIWAKVND